MQGYTFLSYRDWRQPDFLLIQTVKGYLPRSVFPVQFAFFMVGSHIMASQQNSFAETSTDRLFELIETKLHLLTQMQEMTLEQSEMVVRHDMTGLMTLLSRKQSLMDSLQQIQSQLVPFQSQDPELRAWSHPDRRKTCQAMVKRCDELIQFLVVQENRSLDQMSVQRDAVAAQLQQNFDASQIEHAYHTTDQEPPTSDGLLSLTG